MKHLMTIWAVVTMISVMSGITQAAEVLLNGILSGVDSNNIKDDGDGNHDYAINRTPEGTFYWSSGSTISITGTVDVRGLTSGSYLQIGLVDKEQADLSLDTYSWGGYMFNNSAIATFYAGTRNYARLADNNDEYSAQLFNPAGATVGVFDFAIEISNDGTMDLTLHGNSDVSTTYSYGTRNWWDGWAGWSGDELEAGSYLIAQLWIDTANKVTPVTAIYDIKGTSIMPVPAPGAILLGMMGTGLVGWLRRRRSL